jgi:hypothetical protein
LERIITLYFINKMESLKLFLHRCLNNHLQIHKFAAR